MWYDDDDVPDIHPEVDPFTWFRSSFGNAYFSGVSYEQMWQAVQMSETPEQLDAAISAIEDLNNMVYPSVEGDSDEDRLSTESTSAQPQFRTDNVLGWLNRNGQSR